MTNPNTGPALKSLKQSFEQKNYQEGIDLLLEGDHGFSKAQFHFYLGSFYLGQGNLGLGRYHLEVAKREGFHHSILENNIKFVQQRATAQGGSSPQSSQDLLLYRATEMGMDFFLMLALLGLVATLLLRRLKIIPLWGLFVGLALCWAPVVVKKTYLDSLKTAIALDSTKIRNGPSKIFDPIGTLAAGQKVLLGDLNGGWYYIQFPTILNGWIEKKYIGKY